MKFNLQKEKNQNKKITQIFEMKEAFVIKMISFFVANFNSFIQMYLSKKKQK